MTMQKEKKSRKKFGEKPPCGWWIILIAFIFAAACAGLTMITKERLYANLAPYMAICFIALGVEVLIHTLINIGRLPGWGFNLLPVLLCLFFGILLLAVDAMESDILAFYVGYGLLGGCLALISYAFSMKNLAGHYWIPVLVIGLLAALDALVLLFYPLHSYRTLLFWTQLGFVLLALGFLTAVIALALQQRAIKKIRASGSARA
ncbi:MAG: hypothetical protein Q4C55_07395 [Eubacterium sp.]|nr:hypothetical protein [Eubacterium sp.]